MDIREVSPTDCIVGNMCEASLLMADAGDGDDIIEICDGLARVSQICI